MHTPTPPNTAPTPAPPRRTPLPSLTPIPTFVLTYNYATPWPTPFFATPYYPPTPIPTALPPVSGYENINILLVGADKGMGGRVRTDTIIIVSIRKLDNLVTLISVPRDLYVFIPNWKMQRINAAYPHGEITHYPGGGAALLQETILYNLGIEIDHFAMVDFAGFRQAINQLGGVNVPVTCWFSMQILSDPTEDRDNPDNWETLTLKPGVVHMDGTMALRYARSREFSSDFDRARRQQELLRAVYARVMQLDLIPQIPNLYGTFLEMVETDVTVGEAISLAPAAFRLEGARIRSFYIGQSVTRGWTTPLGASVLLPDGPKLMALLTKAMGPPSQGEAKHLRLSVEVRNDSGTAWYDTLAAERLHYTGYNTALVPSSGETAAETTLIATNAQPDPETSAALLALLGLDESRLLHEHVPYNESDYLLVLGRDFRPCFDPAEVER